MPTQITVSEKILHEITEGDRVLVILPEDRNVPLGEVELVSGEDESEEVAVNVLRTSRAQLQHVPVSDRVLNGTEDLMDTLVQLRQQSHTDMTSEDIVTVVRFEPIEEQ